MTLESWLFYVATVLVLMSTPGLSQLLMLSNSASHGFRKSLATACGDLTANALQMLAAGFGLAAILAASGYAITIIKWLGVVYLLWLGFTMLQKAGADSIEKPSSATAVSLKTLWFKGFITSAGNFSITRGR